MVSLGTFSKEERVKKKLQLMMLADVEINKCEVFFNR